MSSAVISHHDTLPSDFTQTLFDDNKAKPNLPDHRFNAEIQGNVIKQQRSGATNNLSPYQCVNAAIKSQYTPRALYLFPLLIANALRIKAHLKQGELNNTYSVEGLDMN